MTASHPTAEPAVHPSDSLLEAIVSFLAPLLMAGCSADPSRARLAALDTVASYRPRNQSELVKIMQIVGFGLMAMDNLRLSMTPDLSLSMVLRLRSGANALNRAAQQNARALEQAQRDNKPPNTAATTGAPFPTLEEHEITETDIHASIQRARALVAAARAQIQDEQPPEAPPEAKATVTPPAPATPLPTPLPALRQTATRAEQQRKLLWADAMTDVANELSANPADASLSDRLWAEALSSSASSLAIAAASTPPGENISIDRTAKRSEPS